MAVAARSPQALLGSALPGNLELHDPPQVGASGLELLIRVLFFKQTILFPDFVMS